MTDPTERHEDRGAQSSPPCDRNPERAATHGLNEGGGVRSSRVLVDHFFRHEHGRIVASLVRVLGPRHIDLALECVQEAALKALMSWPHGVPNNPGAWLRRVARNRAIDEIRRGRWESDDPEDMTRGCMEILAPEQDSSETVRDDHLRLIFTCCHPILSREAQVALTLKTVCGFGTTEIARAFFSNEPALAQRLVRAKRALREQEITYRVPEGHELLARLGSVHQVLLLLFNEGYSSLGGSLSVRLDLMEESLRLTRFLVDDPRTATPASDALYALFCFQSSRNPARIDDRGAMVALADQDRSLWDRRRAETGLIHLARSARGQDETQYHLLAEIASIHALAPRFEDTDWSRILAAYERLLRHGQSSSRFLGLVVAESYASGPEQALRRLDRSRPAFVDPGEPHRESAVRADLLRRAGRPQEARAAYFEAAAAARNPAERLYLLDQTRH